MRTLWWVAIAGLSAVHAPADPVVFCSTTYGTDANTSTGNHDVNCMSSGGFYGAHASALVTEFVAGTNASVLLFANASLSVRPDTIQATAVGEASDLLSLSTGGPSRSGLIEFYISLANMRGGVAEALLSDGVHTYGLTTSFGSCPPFSNPCSEVETLPFNLGSDFQLSVSASSELLGASPDNYGYDAMADVNFRLLEADGLTPVSLLVNPEPKTYGLAVLGFSAIAWLAGKRRLSG